MEERRHSVLLSGKRIGTLFQNGDVVRFTFAPGYWEDPDRNVLGLWFENNPKTSPKAKLRLPVWFSNLLPEGRLREWIALDRGVSTAREMELLLRVGRDLPGAAEVVEDGDSDLVAPVDWERDGRDAIAAAGEPPAWKFSLAGVGLKFSMLKDGDRLTIPASDSLGDWIVKLPDATYGEVPRNEYEMMRLAGRIGIDAPECHLVSRRDLPDLPEVAWPGAEDVAYAVSRFDRTPDRERIHIEDFAQVRGFYSENKYQGTFETVGSLAYRGADIYALQEFARRLTFNVLIGNGDAHLKNWSLIYPDGRSPKLSPAYDLVSTASYIVSGEEDLGLRFGGSRRLSAPSWRHFVHLEERLGARGADLAGVVEETVNRFEAEWAAVDLSNTSLEHVSEWISSHFKSNRRRLLR